MNRREYPLRAARSQGDASAWEESLGRYKPAVRRYLRDAVVDQDAADELYGQFTRIQLSDDPRRDASLERSRDVLRAVVIRLVRDHRQTRRRTAHLPPPTELTADEGDEATRFDAIWRDQLLEHTWRRLDAYEASTGQPFHTALRLRTNAPGLSWTELAVQLGQELGRPMSPDLARQALDRARAEFSQLLLDEVIATLPTGSPFEAIERELIAIGLLAFCRDALGRVRPVPGR